MEASGSVATAEHERNILLTAFHARRKMLFMAYAALILIAFVCSFSGIDKKARLAARPGLALYKRCVAH